MTMQEKIEAAVKAALAAVEEEGENETPTPLIRIEVRTPDSSEMAVGGKSGV